MTPAQPASWADVAKILGAVFGFFGLMMFVGYKLFRWMIRLTDGSNK